MAFTPRVQRQEELVTPKQREALAKKRDEYLQEINNRLNVMPDSGYKQELIGKRDHCFAKFPVFPVDLSVWLVAYFEDWMRDLDKVPETFRR